MISNPNYDRKWLPKRCSLSKKSSSSENIYPIKGIGTAFANQINILKALFYYILINKETNVF